MEESLPDALELVIIEGLKDRLAILVHNDYVMNRLYAPDAPPEATGIFLEVLHISTGTQHTNSGEPRNKNEAAAIRIRALIDADPACREMLRILRSRDIGELVIKSLPFVFKKEQKLLTGTTSTTATAFCRDMEALMMSPDGK